VEQFADKSAADL